MPRSSLMNKGLIEDSDYGRLSFTAPGFAHYIRTSVIGPEGTPAPAPSSTENDPGRQE